MVKGRVQGVWFRQSTCNMAREQRLTGWCRNNSDGTISAVFEGEEPAVERAVTWCAHGPDMARVDNLHVKKLAATGEFGSFEIR
jgi:acylphosphatase